MLDCVSGAKQCNMRVEHMTRELKEKKVAAQSIGKEYTELSNKAKAMTKTVDQLKEELKKYHYDEGAHMELIQNKRSQEAVIMKLREVRVTSCNDVSSLLTGSRTTPKPSLRFRIPLRRPREKL